VGDESHFLFRQKLLGEDRSVRRGVVIVKQPGLFLPKFGAMPSHVLTQSPQNFLVEPGIHGLACWDQCFALPQLLYRWQHKSGIFWIPPRTKHVSLRHSVLQKCQTVPWHMHECDYSCMLIFSNLTYVLQCYMQTCYTDLTPQCGQIFICKYYVWIWQS
jgi:hypothetical protein